MWLTLDAGNSALKGGLFDGSSLLRTFRVAAPFTNTPRWWKQQLLPHINDAPITWAGLSSVVPTATASIRRVLKESRSVETIVISPSLTLPFEIAYETPETLGTDRLAAAAAAAERYGTDASGDRRSVIALDSGTAVTYDVVDRNGIFRGGAIGASPTLLRQALRQGTAQLPDIPLHTPDAPVGRSTQSALQAGIMYGFIDSVAGMIDRMTRQLEDTPYVVATGGWSRLLRHHVGGIHTTAPHLVIEGIRRIMQLNAPDTGNP